MAVNFATDADVEKAIEDHRAWTEKAAPASYAIKGCQPRVMVRLGNEAYALRRPRKRGDQWHVKLAGLPRLCAPVVHDNGDLVFDLYYGRY